MFDPVTINALRILRAKAEKGTLGALATGAFQHLDEAGVFAALDEQVETAKAEGILGETALKGLSWHLGNPDRMLGREAQPDVKSLHEAPFAESHQDQDVRLTARNNIQPLEY